MPVGDGSNEDKKFTVSIDIIIQVTNTQFVVEQILFDTSKKEMLNPNQGYKKIVQKLKGRYKVSTADETLVFHLTQYFEFQCEINKGELTLKRLKECHLLLLGGPRLPFNAQELQDIR